MAFVLDKLSAADGFVKQQVLADLSLRAALEQEGSLFVSLLQNKLKIIALSVIDTVHGKAAQRRLAPEPREDGGGGGPSGGIHIEEEEQSASGAGFS